MNLNSGSYLVLFVLVNIFRSIVSGHLNDSLAKGENNDLLEASTVPVGNITSEEDVIGLSEILTKLDIAFASCNGVDIREITIERVQKLLESGKLCSKKLTKCYLQRISTMNPYLKVVIETNPDAISISEELDMERNKGKVRGPLHGIPILVKDNYSTKDNMETTAGALALIGVKPIRDAEAVKRLRLAGAVILGKANLGELSFFRGSNLPNGWSGRGGQTQNAYNLKTNPQGSSSGSAVATSANLAMAAIGTETDGSLISPSTVAACVSMKSTLGLISTQGIIPISHNQDTAGAITRTVLDTAFMLDGMVSTHRAEVQKCGGSYASCLLQNEDTSFTIGVPRVPFWIPELANSTLLQDELPVLGELLKNLSSHALINVKDPVEQNWTFVKNVSDAETIVVLHDFKIDMNRYLKEETISGLNQTKIKTLADIIAFNKENPTKEGYNQDLLEQSQATDGLKNATYLLTLKTNRDNAREYLNALLVGQDLDAIVVPSEPRYNVTVNPTLDNAPYVAWTIAAVAGYPSITVPVGYDEYGVPFGICIIGRPHSEVTLLKIARLVEQTWPARKPPTFKNELV